VHVRYGDDGGVRVEVGPQADPIHLRRHAETVRQLRRYEGVIGRLRQLLSRVRQLLAGHPAYGTAGFEARLEVQKLNRIIADLQAQQRAVEARADRLTGDQRTDLRQESESIGLEIATLENQLARHEANVDSYAAGRGFVAAEDTTPGMVGARERARRLIARAEAAAPAVRSAIQGAVTAHQGELSGLDHEIKTEDSLTRKIYDRAAQRGEANDASLDREAGRINDALRYTAVVARSTYMQAYAATRSSLEAGGYTFVRAGNAWAEPERFGGAYRGINVTFRTPEGLEFEIQFHTPESLAMQTELHVLYEERRAAGTTREREDELRQEEQRRWGTVPVPTGADAVDRPRGGQRRGGRR
jgi:hypothetical protein